MGLIEKYNFKILDSKEILDFHENMEIDLIENFEKNTLELKINKPPYVMVEVGSHQAYYSLAFKHILGKENTINIMVEPHKPYFELGEKNFAANNCEGYFYNRGIGTEWKIQPNPDFKKFEVNPITLKEIINDHKLNHIDVLHSDIDGSELVLLNENIELFSNKKIKHVYILTHSDDKHNECKKFFNDLQYDLFLDIPYNLKKVGYDGLLIFKSKS